MKRLSLFGAVLVWMGLAGSGFAQTAAQYIAAGNQSYAAKDYVRGAQNYQSAIQADPNSAAAYQGLGNCEYLLGRNREALAAYEKALSLNPNNTQLSNFVQNLRAKVGASAPAPAAAPAATSPAATYSNPSSSRASKMFEIDPMFGVAVASSIARGATLSAPATSIGMGTGIGGGVEGYYLVSGQLGVGLILDFFTGYGVAQAPTTFPYPIQGGGIGTATATTTNNTSSFEVMPAVKYKFEGNTIRPYLLGSLGFASMSTSSTTNITYSGGPSAIAIPNNPPAPTSNSGPMVQLGAGAEYDFGPSMGIFLQVKYSMIFVGDQAVAASGFIPAYTIPGYTFSAIPIEAGLNLDF